MVRVSNSETDQTGEVKVAVFANELKHINESMARIEGKFDDAIKNFVTEKTLHDAQKLADQKHAEQDAAIKRLEEWNVWAVRIVLGLVITAIVGLVLIPKF